MEIQTFNFEYFQLPEAVECPQKLLQNIPE